ncbi:Alpha/Beta hydrolase protein [Xylariales sp. PMI_506]|nr:Alpha/Beta hydrolase protein [Xylariales sp. PMI_506]
MVGTAHNRETFFVGGSYVRQDNGNHTLQGQMYVERLTPVADGDTKPFPLVFIHGGTRTGNDWLTKPDGNPGWAAFFLSQDYEIYLLDLPYRGRSPWNPGNGSLISFSAEQIQEVFTAPASYDLWPQAKMHTQWPGLGVNGDPVFDQFYASAIQMVSDPQLQERAAQQACTALLDKIAKPVILCSHSAGGPVGWLVADARPQLVKMIIAIEPSGPPFEKMTLRKGLQVRYGISDVPITYDPPITDPDVDLVREIVKADSPGLWDCKVQAASPPPRRLANLVNIPVLIVTAQASYHAPYDWSMVLYLRQAGLQVEHLKLEEAGIFGNGHMMFMEKNSDEIAQAIQKHVEKL